MNQNNNYIRYPAEHKFCIKVLLKYKEHFLELLGDLDNAKVISKIVPVFNRRDMMKNYNSIIKIYKENVNEYSNSKEFEKSLKIALSLSSPFMEGQTFSLVDKNNNCEVVLQIPEKINTLYSLFITAHEVAHCLQKLTLSTLTPEQRESYEIDANKQAIMKFQKWGFSITPRIQGLYYMQEAIAELALIDKIPNLKVDRRKTSQARKNRVQEMLNLVPKYSEKEMQAAIKTAYHTELDKRTEQRERRKEVYVVNHQDEWELIGQEMKDRRIALYIRVADVAKNLGVSESTIRRFEKGCPVNNSRLLLNGIRLYLNLRQRESQVNQ